MSADFLFLMGEEIFVAVNGGIYVNITYFEFLIIEQGKKKGLGGVDGDRQQRIFRLQRLAVKSM